MEQIQKILKLFYMPTFNIGDFIEIFIIIYVIYKIISMLKNTRAWIILKGVLMLCAFYLIAHICSFDIIKMIFQGSITVFVIAIVVIFQQELKKMLEQIGNKNLMQYIADFKNKAKKEEKRKRLSDKTIDELISALFALSKTKTGSLIVIEKDVPLNDIVATGISLNADVSSALLINIFEKNTPLHDGAIIVKNDKIVSATCYLPLSSNSEISKSLGTRHRAGIGVTEAVDCLVLISSEETGKISFVENGKITRNATEAQLKEVLTKTQEYPQTGLSNLSPKGHLLNNNFKTKLFATILGLVFWFITMTTIDPVKTITIEDIPINVVNETAITDLNMMYDFGEQTTVDVVVEDKRSILDHLSARDFTATVDLSRLSVTNSVEVMVTVNNDSTDIVKIEDNILNVTLEDISYGEFPIEVDTKGEANVGYSIKEIELSQLTATVIGAETQIDKIDKVVAELNIEGISDGETLKFIPIVYDKNGDIISKDKISFSAEEFTATVYLEKTKIIPLNISITDAENSVGQIKDISYDTTEIVIAGTTELLEQMTSLNITLPVKIDISNDNNTKLTKVITLSEYLPEGITLQDKEQKVTITITYEPFPSKSITIKTEKISLEGARSNLEYDFSTAHLDVAVIAPKDIIETISADDLILVVDVSEISSIGTYDVKVKIKSEKNIIVNEVQTKILVKASDN